MRQLLAEGYDLKNVPGFYRAPIAAQAPGGKEYGPTLEWRMNVGAWHQGFMVHAREVDGMIQGAQIRRAEVKPSLDRDGQPKINPETGEVKMEARYAWFTSAHKEATSHSPAVTRLDGASPKSPVHYRNVELMRATGEAMLTEGVLKADVIAHYLDRGVIGVAGVGNFPKEFGKELREKIPELRRVLLAYDADLVRNPHVQLHLDKLRDNLKDAGFEVRVGRWDESHGKGLDDYCQHKLGREFGSDKTNPERAARQQALLADIGWGDRGHGQQQTIRRQAVGVVNDHVKVEEQDRADRQIDDRLILGTKREAELRLAHAIVKLEEAIGRKETLRHWVTDPVTHLRREMSLADIETRAVAMSYRLAEERKPQNSAERAELQRIEYAHQLGIHSPAIALINYKHEENLKRLDGELQNAQKDFIKASESAGAVEREYKERGKVLPVPIIHAERFAELEREAIARKDTKALEKLETIRRHLPDEFGGGARKDPEAARLAAQAEVAQVSRAASKQRVDDYEKNCHQRRWEVGDERWSLAGIDRRIVRGENKIAYHERGAEFYREKQSPFNTDGTMNLHRRVDYQEKVEEAKAEAAKEKTEVARLKEVREQVVKLVGGEREHLKEVLAGEAGMSQALARMVAGERQARADQGRAMPAAQYTHGEIKRLEAHAADLRSGELLKLCHEHEIKRVAHLKPEEREKAVARAEGREIAAYVAYSETEARLRNFEERRMDTPLHYKDEQGRNKTATLREIEPKSFGDKVTRYLMESPAERTERDTIRRAAADHYNDLILTRDRAEKYCVAASDAAHGFKAHVNGTDQQNTLAPSSRFTAKEVAQIEAFAHRQGDPSLRMKYEDMIRSAIKEGRVSYSQPDYFADKDQLLMRARGSAQYVQKSDEAAPQMQQTNGRIMTPAKAEQQQRSKSTYDQGQNTPQNSRGVGISW